MACARGVMPLVARHLDAAHIADGVSAACGPEGVAGCVCDLFDDARMGRLLKDHEVGRDRADHFRQSPFAPAPAEAYVVAQEPHDAAPVLAESAAVSGSMSVK